MQTELRFRYSTFKPPANQLPSLPHLPSPELLREALEEMLSSAEWEVQALSGAWVPRIAKSVRTSMLAFLAYPTMEPFMIEAKEHIVCSETEGSTETMKIQVTVCKGSRDCTAWPALLEAKRNHKSVQWLARKGALPRQPCLACMMPRSPHTLHLLLLHCV